MAGFFRTLAEQARQPQLDLRPSSSRFLAPALLGDEPAPELPSMSYPTAVHRQEACVASIKVGESDVDAGTRHDQASRNRSAAEAHSAPTRTVAAHASASDSPSPQRQSANLVAEAIIPREMAAARMSNARDIPDRARDVGPDPKPQRTERSDRPARNAELAKGARHGTAIPARLSSRSPIFRERESVDKHIQGDSIPDVHIHIGRIELTAAASADKPRRASAQSKKPMSLDEYLGSRRKGAP